MPLSPFRPVKPKMSREGSYDSVCSDPAFQRTSNGSSKSILKSGMERTNAYRTGMKRIRDISRGIDGRHTVRFSPEIDEVVCYVPSVDDMDADEQLALFTTNEDLKRMRLDAKIVVKYYRTKDPQALKMIDDAYSKAVRVSCSFFETSSGNNVSTMGSYMKFMKTGVKEVAMDYLSLWSCKKATARGLERHASVKHRTERTEFASQSRKAVLRLIRNSSVDAEQVAQFYEEYARSAVVYARMTGEADAFAAEHAANSMDSKIVRREARKEKEKPRVQKEIEFQPPPISNNSFDRRELLKKDNARSNSARMLAEKLSNSARRLNTLVSI